MPYTDPTFDTTYTDPQYTSGAGILEQQQQTETAGLNQQIAGLEPTYANRRASTIRTYQDALDQINQSLHDTGINIRGNYAGRNLYNASGEVSGLGQMYGANELAPGLQALSRTSTRQAEDLSSLEGQKAADLSKLQTQLAGLGTTYAGKKFDLAQTIFGAIKDAAYRQYGTTTDEANTAYARGQDTLARKDKATGDVSQQESAGRRLLYQKDLAGAVKKYGKDALIRIGKQTFLLSSEERLGLAQAKKSLSKTTSNGPSLTQTKDERTQTYNTDLNAFKDIVVTSRNPGDGEVTREQLIEALAQDHPWKSRAQISEEVYKAYSDKYR